MKKRILSMMLSIVMVFTMLPAFSLTASAADAHTHAITSGSDELTWTPITQLSEITEAGNYYLTADILMTSNLNISDEVNLCLNGNKIYTQTGSSYGTVKVAFGGTLNICDCSAGGTGIITTVRGQFALENKGTVNLYSGSVERDCDDSEAAVKNHSGAIFNMHGGEICGNAMGFKNEGTLNISGGTVSVQRSAIQADAGKVTVSGNAMITTSDTSTWATVSIYGGTFNIQGGTVTHGNGKTAIQVPSGTSELNISSGTVTTGGGNALYLVSSDADVNITGGSISNTLGSVSYSSNAGQRKGWGISVAGFKSLTVSGAPAIDEIYLPAGYTITVGQNGLSNTTPIGVYCAGSAPAAVTGQNDQDYSGYFTAKANSSSYHVYNDNNTVMFGLINSYDVTVGSTTNGTVTSDTETAVERQTVFLTVSPADGYELDTLSVKDANDQTVPVGTSNDKYMFVMPGSDVTVTATFKEIVAAPADTITVESPRGDSKEITIDFSKTVGDLKNAVAQEFGVTFGGESEYRLFGEDLSYPNSKLDDDTKVLSAIGFESGQTVHLEKSTNWDASGSEPIKIFGLTITGGKGSQEPYGDYTNVDYYWNYYYKTITIKSDANITISGTGERNTNIIIKNAGSGKYTNLTISDLSLTNDDGDCINVQSDSWVKLTVMGNNTLTSTGENTPYTADQDPALTLTNSGAYLKIMSASTGTLTATTNIAGQPGIGTYDNTSEVWGIEILGGTIIANGGKNAPGIRAQAVCIYGGNVTANGGIATYGTNALYENQLEIRGGTVVATSDTKALSTAPVLTNYTYHTATASVNSDGTNAVTYDSTANDTYKYFKIEPRNVYTVTVADSSNGSVTADPAAAGAGDNITLTIAPENGYTLDTLTVKDAANADVSVSGEGNIRTFIMPAGDVTITATFEQDIPEVPGSITVGDFTITPTDGSSELTADTDYVYKNGVLNVMTTTPVTIAMRSGVSTTEETIVVDGTDGEASVTFDSIAINTTEDDAISVKGTNEVTLTFTGDSTLTAADDAIVAKSTVPLVLTSTDEGSLSISDTKYGIYLDGSTEGGGVTINGNIQLDISNADINKSYGIYLKNVGDLIISGSPVINIDTYGSALDAQNIEISGGVLTLKNDKYRVIQADDGHTVTISGNADIHILEAAGGIDASEDEIEGENGEEIIVPGKIIITDNAKVKMYNLDAQGNRIGGVSEYPLSASELTIDKNAVVDVYIDGNGYGFYGDKTTITDNADVDLKIVTTTASSRSAIRISGAPLEISGNATVDIVIDGAKVYGLYGASETVNISGSAVVNIKGAYRGIYADYINVYGNAKVDVSEDKNYAIYCDDGAFTISDTATVTASSDNGAVNFYAKPKVITVTPAEGKVYAITQGDSKADPATKYCTEKTDVSNDSAKKYFHAEAIDTVPITEASVEINAPVKNGTPATTAEIASDVNYTVSDVTWNGDPTKFLGGTEYTATFTLTPAAGYAFVSDTAVTVEGATVTTSLSNGSLIVNAKFPVTAAAVPVSVDVKTAPSDVEYTYGDEFDPTGLVITVTNDDGTAQDVTYNDETADDFAFSPNELTVATTQITVTYAGKTAEIGITVAKQPVTAPENAGNKQFTGETLRAYVDVTDKPYTVATNEGGINVGEYDVVLTLTDPDNYKWSDSEGVDKTIKFSITKADALTLNGTATMVKDHVNHTVEIDLTSISGYPTNPGGTPAFALTSRDGYNGLTSVTLNGSVLTLVADKTTNDTVDTVTVAVTGMGNYADTTTITITVSYTDKTVAAITGVEAAENLIYSGEVQPGYTGTPSSEYNGAYTITYTGTDKTGKAYGPTSDAPVNAGDYSVTFAVPDSSTQYAGSKTINFTINKKSVTVSADNKEAYVWGRMPELTYKAVGLIGNDTINVELSCDANMNRVGEYPIVVSANDESGNYEITTVNGTLTVKMIYIPIVNPTYPPVVEDSDNGDVTVSPKNPEKGDTVTITPDPDAGYEVDEVIATDKNGNPVTVIDNGDGTYSFKQPNSKVTIEVTYKKIDTTCPRDRTCPMYGYTDLDRTAWYHDGVHYCIENGLMQGIGNNQFAPSSTTTRAMIVTILWRLEGSPVVNYAMDFEDVAANQWYTEAIRWAAKEKIVEGYGNGKFGTNDAITREQMVTIMYRYAKYKGYDVSVGENTNILSYGDAFDVAEWAIPAMQWACGEGIITGIADGSTMNLDPQGNATRAQAAAILQRYCENVAKKD